MNTLMMIRLPKKKKNKKNDMMNGFELGRGFKSLPLKPVTGITIEDHPYEAAIMKR